MGENFCQILGYEGFYDISDQGKVISLARKKSHPRKGTSTIKERYLKIQTDHNGYCYVKLNKNGASKTYKVHVLVAKAFIPNPNNLPFVNHKDGDKSNNNKSNLEWCTQSENEKHAHSIGLKNHKGENHPRGKFTNDLILEVRRLFEVEKISQREIGRRVNINYKTIHKIVHKQRWAHI